MILPVDKRRSVSVFRCRSVIYHVIVFIKKVRAAMCVYYYVIVRARISGPITCNGDV